MGYVLGYLFFFKVLDMAQQQFWIKNQHPQDQKSMWIVTRWNKLLLLSDKEIEDVNEICFGKDWNLMCKHEQTSTKIIVYNSLDRV